MKKTIHNGTGMPSFKLLMLLSLSLSFKSLVLLSYPDSSDITFISDQKNIKQIKQRGIRTIDPDTTLDVDTHSAKNSIYCEEIEGCTSLTACNYNPQANKDDGSCVEPVPGCIECDGKGGYTFIDIIPEGGNEIPDCQEDEVLYQMALVKNTCANLDLCIPISTAPGYSMENIIGFDATLQYDTTKVYPTGYVTVYDGPVESQFTNYATNISKEKGLMNIAIFLNSYAPVGTSWNGTGNVFCVGFKKKEDYTFDNQSYFEIHQLIESYISGIRKTNKISKFYSNLKDTVFSGQLVFWKDSQPIRWDEDNPGKYAITNIYGTDSTCYPLSGKYNQPNVSGKFSFDIHTGQRIHIDRNIKGETPVMSVINGYDAFHVLQVVLNIQDWVPDVFQIIAMDVNMDGTVSSGDVSQINKRTVRIIDEFHQAWNYNDADEKTLDNPSKDWVFINQSFIDSLPAYSISSLYPDDDQSGFSKWRVPIVPHCLEIPSSNECELEDQVYTGILLGDIDGNYATRSIDGKLKSTGDLSDTVYLDQGKCIVTERYIDIPVFYQASGKNAALDFILKYDLDKIKYLETIEAVDNNLISLANTWGPDSTLYFTCLSSYSLPVNSQICKLRFEKTVSSISEVTNLFQPIEAYLNGNPVNLNIHKPGKYKNQNPDEEITNSGQNFYLNAYPNPTKNILHIELSDDSFIEVIDLAGKIVLKSYAISNKHNSIQLGFMPSGLYILKVKNNENLKYKKIIKL